MLQDHKYSLSSSGNKWFIICEPFAKLVSQDVLLSKIFKVETKRVKRIDQSPVSLYILHKPECKNQASVEHPFDASKKAADIVKQLNIPEEVTRPEEYCKGEWKPRTDWHLDVLLDENSGRLQAFNKTYLLLVTAMIQKLGGTKDDGQDIYQEAMVDILQRAKFGSLKITTGFVQYFIRTCKNKWFDILKNKKKNPVKSLDPTMHMGLIDNSFENQEQYLWNEQLMQLFEESFEKLSMCQQRILILWTIDTPMKEAALILNNTAASARKSNCNSKKCLKSTMMRSPSYVRLED